MRSLRIRSASSSPKIIAAGALSVAGAMGLLVANVPDASAAGPWSATALSDAQYWCVSDGCEAGGVGYVPHNGTVEIYNAPKIGAWKRTVNIYCKIIRQGAGVIEYQVEVKDKNWSGSWEMYKNKIQDSDHLDDSGIPECP